MLFGHLTECKKLNTIYRLNSVNGDCIMNFYDEPYYDMHMPLMDVFDHKASLCGGVLDLSLSRVVH